MTEEIRILSGAEHIRKHPAMYIANLNGGSAPADGVYSLIREIVENSVDEYRAGHGPIIEVHMEPAEFAVRDYGRGIPLEALRTVCEKNYSSGKFNHKVYKNAIGLHGLGLKVVMNLCRKFEIRSIRNGSFRRLVYQQGKLFSDKTGGTPDANGCEVHAWPDETVFAGLTLREECTEQLLMDLMAANAELQINLNNRELPVIKNMADYLSRKVDMADACGAMLGSHRGAIQFAVQQCDRGEGAWYSFANGHPTGNGGVHVDAVKAALAESARHFWKDGMNGKTLQARDVLTGIYGAVSVRLPDPKFEAQTKNRLNNTDLFSIWKSFCRNIIENYWVGHPEECENFFRQIDNVIFRRTKMPPVHETTK